MAERIVYVLGAGFSQPLGLPLMSDFLQKAKALNRELPEKCKHFKGVYDEVRRLYPAKSRFRVDLENIEEVLCLIDMEDLLVDGGASGARGADRAAFERFIKDVIKAYTPAPTSPSFAGEAGPGIPERFQTGIFGDARQPISDYGGFAASLVGLEILAPPMNVDDLYHEPVGKQPTAREMRSDFTKDAGHKYAVVTLNYDRVLEEILSYVDRTFPPRNANGGGALGRLQLAKLHGCVNGKIVPPSWRKIADWEAVKPEWLKAFDLLRNAEQIRILGYSLPHSDFYVRYLLSAATLNSPNLNLTRVDVVNRDEEAKDRYEEFIEGSYLHYAKADLSEYLSNFRPDGKKIPVDRDGMRAFMFDGLETAHQSFMREHEA